MEITSTTNVISKLLQIESQFLKFTHSSTLVKPRNRNPPPFLTHCSTNPNANKNSTYERNSSNPDSKRVKFLNSTRVSLLSRGLIFDSGPDRELLGRARNRFAGGEEVHRRRGKEVVHVVQWPVSPELKRRLQQRDPLGKWRPTHPVQFRRGPCHGLQPGLVGL
ncbi:RecF/RecN/SMC N terminal domain protein [Striga asiatica]|uniref:RecF/RecN/SMC N terminal domain protein n=1 Tax=Striga asiatica TaxID=4170 RepID=A0A5A7PEW0_STRAF|nr:RecF/RecN/SMC N terminal domain protein [Striga asiatica]